MKTLFQCEPGYETALREAGLLDFDALMKVKGGPSASSHAHRETIPLEIAVDSRPRKFYLKRVFKVPSKHALAPLLQFQAGLSQPQIEWNILGKLEKAGIPAMRRVTFGERSWLGVPRQALILVEAVSMPHTIEDWLVPGFPKPCRLEPQRRHRLLYEFGQFVGRFHDRGFRWPDLHPKHVFAEPVSDDHDAQQWRFCLIDVERMTCVDTGSQFDESAQRDLKRLRRHMAPLAMTAWNLSLFAAGYSHDARQARGTDNDAEVSKLGGLLRSMATPRLPDDYEHPRAVPLERLKRMYIDARVARYFSQLGWQSISDVFAYQRGQDLCKPGLESYRERIRIQTPEGNGSVKTYYLKRYDHPPLAEQLRRIREFRPSRSSAAREMHFIKRLSQIGVPTLQSIAFGQEMTGIWERRSFGLTAELDGQSLEKMLLRWTSDPKSLPSPRERHEIIRQLGLLVRLLHEHDLFHRDLYLAHVFLTRNDDGQIVLRLIDLARMIERPWNPRRWAIKDLAALAYSSPSPPITRADRIRFLYHYLGNPSADDMKRLVRCYVDDIEAKVCRIAQHDRRRTAHLAGKAPA